MKMKCRPLVLFFVAACSTISVESAPKNVTEFFPVTAFLDIYVPWRTENVQCYKEASYFRNEALHQVPWALQMLDASSKFPSSLLQGNTFDLGNFDQCLAVLSDPVVDSLTVAGQYCLVASRFKQTNQLSTGSLIQNFTWSVCLPASCTPEDLLQQLNFSLSATATDFQVLGCQVPSKTIFSQNSWIFLSLTLFFLVFVLFATWLETSSVEIANQMIKAVVLSFSLRKNGKTLWSSATPGLKVQSIYGLRALATLGFLIYSRFLQEIQENRASLNHAIVPKSLSRNVGGILVYNSLLAIDVFFLLGGFTQAYSFMKERKAQAPFSVFKHVTYRYLRVTPVYLFVILLFSTIFNDLGSGPLWSSVVTSEQMNCIQNWWKNILYINNVLPGKYSEMCLPYTWYLGAEMQYYLIAPIFLFALIKHQTVGILVTILGIVASSVFTFCTTYVNDYPWTILVDYDSVKRSIYFVEVFVAMYVRISPYLIGLLIGYYVEHLSGEKTRLSASYQALGWIISFVLFLAVAVGLPIGHAYVSGAFLSALYASLHRPLFIIPVAWIIFVTERGYGGGIKKFLSSRVFEVLSRLSFCFFLLHYVPIKYERGTQRTAGYFTYYSILQKLSFDVCVTLILSVAITLLFQLPLVNLNKLLFKSKKLSQAHVKFNYDKEGTELENKALHASQ